MALASTDWSQGYATETPYTYGYYRELAPTLLDTALLAKNTSHSATSGAYRYCELGCGRGLTTNILAAANPAAEFWATDFNPAHIADAQDLARAAGIGNARFLEASFDDLGKHDLPEFDFITLHGIYSWVSPANRAAIVRFIGRHLKPGGVVYVSYNTLPGWTQSQPLRRLIHDAMAQGNEPVTQRMKRAIGIATRLRESKANYFRANKQADDLLERMRGMNSSYVIHEYYNRDWTALYHADVAQDLAAAKVDFAAHATLLDHIDSLNLNADQIALLGEQHDAVYIETLRDFMVNRRFRRDVFVKGARRMPPAEARARWNELRLALATPRAAVPMHVEGASRRASLAPDIYEPILDALARGPRSVAQMRSEDKRIAALKNGVLIQAVVMLIGAGHAEPCLDAQGLATRSEATRRINRAILERARVSGEISTLASPVTGSGVAVSRTDQVFLLAHELAQADAVGFAAQALQAQRVRLLVDGKPAESDEAMITELRRRAGEFERNTLPMLRGLGIA